MSLTSFRFVRDSILVLVLVFYLVSSQLNSLYAQEIEYHWQAGGYHQYDLKIESEWEDTKVVIDGDIKLFVKGPVSDSWNSDGTRLPKKQSGTGLLISQQSMLTSSGLVEKAEKISIRFGEKTFTAKVVWTDEFSGLALLELSDTIEAPHPEISQEQEFNRNESIFVLGSPSDSELLKVKYRGYQHSNGKEKVSVSAVPGSQVLGAPLLNQDGSVVGLITSQSQTEPTRWEAAPAKEILNLLDQYNVQLPVQQKKFENNEEMIRHHRQHTLPVLVRRQSSDASPSLIKFEATYSTRVVHDDRRGRFRQPDRVTDSGEMLVSPAGEIIRFTGEEHLPFLLGSVGSFPIEALVHNGEKKWGSESKTAIAIIEEDHSRNVHGFPFHRRRNQPDRVSSTTAATEKSEYEIIEKSDSITKLRKKFELVSLDHAQHPMFRFTGESELNFNSELGVIESNEFEGTLVRNSKNMTIRIPVKVSLVRKTAEQIAAERKSAQARREAIRIKRETPFTDSEMTAIMKDLTSGNNAKSTHALVKLSQKTPPHGNQELARVLVDRINDKVFANGFYRNALEKWATDDTGPDLLEHLKVSDDTFMCHLIIELITKFKTPGAAEAIAPMLANGHTRSTAQQSLTQFGSEAEVPTLKQLKSSDRWVRYSAISVLERVGTKKSLSKLKEIAASDKDRGIQHQAKRAIQVIESREK